MKAIYAFLTIGSFAFMYVLAVETRSGHSVETLSADWEGFKHKHGKKYRNQAHHDKAKKTYHDTVNRINAHNAQYASGHKKHKLALNKYADIDQATFHAKHHGLNKHRNLNSRRSTAEESEIKNRQVRSHPAHNFDWRYSSNGNMISAVRDQDPCGDCWSFSTMGAIESQLLMQNGNTVLLSEQQLVDCDANQGSGGGGCDGGGWPDLALQYLESAGGAMSDSSYPYGSGNPNSPIYDSSGTCQFNSSGVVVTITGMKKVSMPTTDSVLKGAVYHNGPHSLIVDASLWDSQYATGYLPCKESPEADHAIMLIGYGTDEYGTAYWIIKNQWGTGWGMEGFGYIQMGDGYDCGTGQFMALTPTIA